MVHLSLSWWNVLFIFPLNFNEWDLYWNHFPVHHKSMHTRSPLPKTGSRHQRQLYTWHLSVACESSSPWPILKVFSIQWTTPPFVLSTERLWPHEWTRALWHIICPGQKIGQDTWPHSKERLFFSDRRIVKSSRTIGATQLRYSMQDFFVFCFLKCHWLFWLVHKIPASDELCALCEWTADL